MANSYDIIEYLCMRAGIKPGKLCSEIGMSRGILSDLKAGRTKELSLANAQRIANYFQVSTDIFNEGVFEETLPNSADMELLEDIQRKFVMKKETPEAHGSGVTDDDIKFALFGGDGEITDAMYDEVKRFAAFVKQREAEKKKEE